MIKTAARGVKEILAGEHLLREALTAAEQERDEDEADDDRSIGHHFHSLIHGPGF